MFPEPRPSRGKNAVGSAESTSHRPRIFRSSIVQFVISSFELDGGWSCVSIIT